jgi:hypothetical protein
MFGTIGKGIVVKASLQGSEMMYKVLRIGVLVG